jgi:hypothetical protein
MLLSRNGMTGSGAKTQVSACGEHQRASILAGKGFFGGVAVKGR